MQYKRITSALIFFIHLLISKEIILLLVFVPHFSYNTPYTQIFSFRVMLMNGKCGHTPIKRMWYIISAFVHIY